MRAILQRAARHGAGPWLPAGAFALLAFAIIAGATAPEPASAPGGDPADAAPFHELPFAVGDLPGTLAVPDGPGPHPVVVLVHGSGMQDRDASLGPNQPFRDLAYGLAQRGVASLRYDKRSRVRVDTLDEHSTAQDVTIADAVHALGLLRDQPRIDARRRVLLGHSLGGQFAPRIAAQAPGLAGVVMLAPLARPFHHAIADQTRYLVELDGQVSQLEAVSVRQVEALRDGIDAMVAGGPPPGEPLLGIPDDYWRDLARHDPIAEARALRLPILLLQGERDYQVRPELDFAAWQAALAGQPGATLRRYPGLNHWFIRGEGPANPREYQRRGWFEPAVIDDIARWIHALPPSETPAHAR